MESAVIVKESEEDENDELNNLEENPKDNTGVYVFDSIKEVGNENGTLEEGDDANIEGATEVLAAVSEEGSNPDFEIVENESTQNLSVESESGSTKVEMVSENCDKSANSEPEVEQSMKLPDTVTHIVSRCGVNVYIVGTAHFSHESQEDVAKVRLMPNIFLSNLKKNVWFHYILCRPFWWHAHEWSSSNCALVVLTFYVSTKKPFSKKQKISTLVKISNIA